MASTIFVLLINTNFLTTTLKGILPIVTVSEIATISTVCLLLLFRIAPPLPKTALLGNVQAPPPPVVTLEAY